MKTKFDALQDFKKMIVNSWTWERLTEKQQKRFMDLLSWTRFETKGTYDQAFKQLQDYYDMFIWGIETIDKEILEP